MWLASKPTNVCHYVHRVHRHTHTQRSAESWETRALTCWSNENNKTQIIVHIMVWKKNRAFISSLLHVHSKCSNSWWNDLSMENHTKFISKDHHLIPSKSGIHTHSLMQCKDDDNNETVLVHLLGMIINILNIGSLKFPFELSLFTWPHGRVFEEFSTKVHRFSHSRIEIDWTIIYHFRCGAQLHAPQ